LHTPQDTLKVDFANRDMQKRIAGGKSQDLAKAVGVGRGQVPYPHVLDATAGLGRDAFVLASLGCKVHMLERHPLLAALLADALARAHHMPDIRDAATRLSLESRDALDVLTEDTQYDVIYLDPMYPETNKKALPKKNMQVLRGLLGSDDASGLLEHALATNVSRIVIKRPKHAPKTPAPSVSITGKQTRFDVYVR
jgi:16S rRNA (guanine1516-N2)-methyltransferase